MDSPSSISNIMVGVDLVSISRFKYFLHRFDNNFKKLIFTTYELDHYKSVQRLAARYAAKEAVSKVLEVGLAHMSHDGVPATDIEVRSQDNGAPILKLYGQAEELAHQQYIQTLKISISHERHYAIAMVTGICY